MLARISEKLRIHSKPMKEKIELTLYRLNTQLNKLKQVSAKMQQRDKELFDKCVAAYLSKDVDRASIYANECAEVRRMAKAVLTAELALEQAALRLQTVEELGDVMIQLKPIMSIIHGVGKQLATIAPEVAHELNGINKELSATLVEVNAPTQLVNLEVIDPEAQRVLSEASTIAEQKVQENFPEIPVNLKQEAKAPEPVAVPVALGGEDLKVKVEKDLEDKVYNYIKMVGGTINLARCSKELGLPLGTVKELIMKLKDEGRIAID
ncbi:MAG: Snf7 family protein [Candidatus Nezhaarchaeales archaeon]